jgi:hypothetical protein
MATVHDKVADQISKINPRVEEQVVGVLVDRELKKRSDALVNVLDKLATLAGQLKKIRPDQGSYDADGKETASWFSKAKAQEKKKLEEQVSKMENAINKALTTGDYSNVYNIAAGKDPKPSGSGDSAETDTGDTD